MPAFVVPRASSAAIALLACALAGGVGLPVAAAATAAPTAASTASHGRSVAAGRAAKPGPRRVAAKPSHAGLDYSGRRRVGKASYYDSRFVGRRMADGTRMDPRRHDAASKTLPLGTRARVRNLATGRSAVVTIRDRGPYVDGRIVDLTPATAQQVGLTPKEGIADVEVTPIWLPSADGDAGPGGTAGDDGR